MVKRPIEPFYDASHNTKPNFRDKDNAQPTLKPSFAKQPAPNLAPSGMKGIQATPQLLKQPAEPEKKIESIVKTHPKPELLTGGRFTDKQDYGFAVEVNPFRTPMGIESGKITSLEIQHHGKIIAQYKDAQWTKIPDNADQKDLVQRLQDQFGEPRRDFVPIVPLSPDKDRGHDR